MKHMENLHCVGYDPLLNIRLRYDVDTDSIKYFLRDVVVWKLSEQGVICKLLSNLASIINDRHHMP